MNRTDHRVIFTALSFLAVVLQEVPLDEQAAHARSLARLIEDFCVDATPDAFNPTLYLCRRSEADRLLNEYLMALRGDGEAYLDYDRNTLLGMYERLQVELDRHRQKEFYALATDEIIAARIVQMAEEMLRYEEGSAA